MKKQEFLSELKKRFKYVGEIAWNMYGFIGLKRFKIEVGLVDSQQDGTHSQVYRDTISFWIRNEGKPDEEILDIKWEGSHFKIDAKIENLLKDSGIHYESDRYQ